MSRGHGAEPGFACLRVQLQDVIEMLSYFGPGHRVVLMGAHCTSPCKIKSTVLGGPRSINEVRSATFPRPCPKVAVEASAADASLNSTPAVSGTGGNSMETPLFFKAS